jgi:hypothetical protein
MINKLMDLVSAFALAGIIRTLGDPSEPPRKPHGPG